MDYDEAVLKQMREMLDVYADSGQPPSADTQKLFAENPAECNALLAELFEQYDRGDKTDREIEALLVLQVIVYQIESPARTAALRRMDVLYAAYHYPPTCLNLMRYQLRGVVHGGEPTGPCEVLVSEYPDVARELLAERIRSQEQDSFYPHFDRSSAWNNTQKDIDGLWAMMARTTAQRTMNEIGKRVDESLTRLVNAFPPPEKPEYRLRRSAND